MSVYFVTGKLGAGKTLSSVFKIKEYLMKGRPVASNLNISLTAMFGYRAKNINLIRLPDKPDINDLNSIGYANRTYDESKNGLLVLDECGTWFNSRSWGDKSRQEILDWFRHARKLGWDIIFLVQSLHVVDKQARLSLAEFVVYCRRIDKIKIPYIHWLLKLVTFGTFKLPKLHISTVKYGDSPTALTVDKWIYEGSSLYSCYDTKQIFSDSYESASYCVLPPFYYTSPRSKFGLSFIMRITKLYFKRSKRLTLILLGVIVTILSQSIYSKYFQSIPDNKINSLNSVYIDSYTKLGNQSNYTFITPDGIKTQSDFEKLGVSVTHVSSCSAKLNLNGVSYEVACK